MPPLSLVFLKPTFGSYRSGSCVFSSRPHAGNIPVPVKRTILAKRSFKRRFFGQSAIFRKFAQISEPTSVSNYRTIVIDFIYTKAPSHDAVRFRCGNELSDGLLRRNQSSRETSSDPFTRKSSEPSKSARKKYPPPQKLRQIYPCKKNTSPLTITKIVSLEDR